MNLFSLFKTKSKSIYVLLCILGLVSSLTSLGILMVINMSVGGVRTPLFGAYNYLAFIGLLAISFASTVFFQRNMADLTNDVVFDMEMSIIRKIRNASFTSFEKLGREKIYTTLLDAWILGRVPETLVFLINASVSVICSVFYLFWISPVGGIVIVLLLVILLFYFHYKSKQIAKTVREVRKIHNKYYGALDELMNGFKQLKVSRKRDGALYNDYLLKYRDIIRTLNIGIAKKYLVSQLFASYSWYILIGVIVFLLPVAVHTNAIQTASFITIILFILSPLTGLINTMPFFNNVNNAVERISELDELLEGDAVMSDPDDRGKADFKTIRFENVVYRYKNGEKPSFAVSIEDLTITRNEVLFIVGSNGGGKTTFLNILTGLYRPQSGRVLIDEKELSWEDFRIFSNNMAVVFTDQHLFKQNYDGHDISESNQNLSALQDLINLKGIARIDTADSRFETDLSKGQQKRLLLLMAMLEEKQIVVLDEWAAEQDAFNRKCFYTQWIRRMKEEGRTVVAITHDNDFFFAADRLLWFSKGKLIDNADNLTLNDFKAEVTHE